jgi:hypothetical protein
MNETKRHESFLKNFGLIWTIQILEIWKMKKPKSKLPTQVSIAISPVLLVQ